MTEWLFEVTCGTAPFSPHDNCLVVEFTVRVGDSILWHARSHRNSKLYEETLNKKLPSCEALRQIYGGG